MRNTQTLQQRSVLELKLSQRMMMSPQMQQALQCLQLPIMELSQLITQEMESNPLLELEGEDPPDSPYYRTPFRKQGEFHENLLSDTITLRDFLFSQLRDSSLDDNERALGEFIIDNLDGRGFLNISEREISLLTKQSIENVLKVIKLIQEMDPPGIGARNIQEGLLLQLKRRGKENDVSYIIVDKYYEDLLKNRMTKISKALRCSMAELNETIRTEIATLELSPGANYAHILVQGIVPDIVITNDSDGFRIEVIDDYSDRLRLNSYYMKLFDDPKIPVETKNFIKERLQSAKWLMRSIYQRNTTLHRIAAELLELNRQYFSAPEGTLIPLTMKQLAERLELHESTIARAVASKYLSSERGMLLLKDFFTKGYRTERGESISSKTIQDKLRRLIEEEDPAAPLSDQELSKLLKQQGIKCARRTVAKYRDAMNISKALGRRTKI